MFDILKPVPDHQEGDQKQGEISIRNENGNNDKVKVERVIFNQGNVIASFKVKDRNER